MKWLEVSLEVSGELAEAVADLFARFAPTGVALHYGDLELSLPDASQINRMTVRAYLPADETLAPTKRKIEEGLWHLSQIETLPQATFRFIEQEDWSHQWREHYRPIPVGKRFMIRPPWYSAPDDGRLVIILDPGLAFGTGTHPTTQLCLKALEEVMQSGYRVLDLGCGSGILSIAAAQLGAAHVLALDTDPQAVEVARENVQRNSVEQIVQIEEGSLPLALAKTRQENVCPDILMANINAVILEGMLDAGLRNVVREKGTLILSGILEKHAESLRSKCQMHGLQEIDTHQDQDWMAFILRA